MPKYSPTLYDELPAYQPTANPKHGSGGVENMPTYLNTRELYWLLQGAKESNKRNEYKLTPQALVTKLLVEGRGDAGTNEFDTKNQKSWNMYKAVNEAVGGKALPNNMRMISELAGTFAAAVRDKAEVAKRLNIPFERAWNGTGVSASTGKSGQQHSNRFDQAMQLGAATNPKNAHLLDYVTRALAGALTPQEHLAARISDLEKENLTTGGTSPMRAISHMFGNALGKGQYTSMLESLTPELINTRAKNVYRNAAGIPEIPLEATDIMSGATSTQRTEADILMSLPQVQTLINQLTGVKP